MTRQMGFLCPDTQHCQGRCAQPDAGESLPAVSARIGDHVETLAKAYVHRGHRGDRAAADDLGVQLGGWI